MAANKNSSRLLSNFLSLSALQIFTYALPLLTLPYLVRVLGVEKYGLVMFAQSFIMFFIILVDYGFNLSATREISVYRDNKEKVSEIYSSVMTIKVFLIFLSFFILSVVVFSFEKFNQDKELYLITYLMVVGQGLFPVWYFQGLERMKYITGINILSRVIFTVAIFVFVNEADDYMLVPLLNGLGITIGSLYSLYLIKTSFKQKFTLQSFDTIRTHFKDSTDFFLSRVSVSIYTSANAFVLGLFTNNSMVGYYSIAEKLYQAIQGLYGPISQALYPYVAKEKNITLYKKIFFSVIAVNIIGVIFMFFLGEPLFTVVFTNEIGSETIKVFYVLLLANLFAVPSVLIGYPFLAALGYIKDANNSVIMGSFVHIISLSLLAYLDLITIYNVAYMVVLTEITVLTYRISKVYNYRIWNIKII